MCFLPKKTVKYFLNRLHNNVRSEGLRPDHFNCPRRMQNLKHYLQKSRIALKLQDLFQDFHT